MSELAPQPAGESWSGDTTAIDWAAQAAETASPPQIANDGAVTPATVFKALIDAPPTTIAATGIETLDRLCHGGFPVPWRVIVVGMPSAWKTGFAYYIANKLEHADGFYVGALALDEEAEDVAVRLAQMAGFSREKLQKQDHKELADARATFADARFVFYDFKWTIEKAGADLAKRAAAVGARAVLVIDSLQTARSDAIAAKAAPTPRDTVEANVAAFREVTTAYKMLGIATSEANRAAYRDGGVMQASMAAGAESRSIEYAAQSLIVLRADESQPDTIFHADVAKNRARLKGSFCFKLDRPTHMIDEVDEGSLKADQKEARQTERKAEADKTLRESAVHVARELLEQPGITTNALHSALKARHGSFAESRATTGLKALGSGVTVLEGAGRAKHHYLNGAQLPEWVTQALPGAAAVLPPSSIPSQAAA